MSTTALKTIAKKPTTVKMAKVGLVSAEKKLAEAKQKPKAIDKQITAKPAVIKATKVVTKAAIKPVTKVINKPPIKPVDKAMTKSATKKQAAPVKQATPKPIAKPVAVAKPVVKAPIKPVVKTPVKAVAKKPALAVKTVKTSSAVPTNKALMKQMGQALLANA